MKPSRQQDALRYHASGKPGKIEVVTSKPCTTQLDLSLAYTPGVAEPCRQIAQTPDKVFDYTVKGNLVAVITDGSAVLGLGNIGPLASKPVMEGKGVLFKRFANIDVFDLELNSESPDDFVRIVKALEPTFGGINLEDIKAPECFYIEEQLREKMNIPVFHDDQHGTAIIVGAALLNALELVEKPIEDVKVTFTGAGAAAIACAKLFVELGVKREHITMVDIEGVVYKGREALMDPYKGAFAQETEARTLAEVIPGSDVFVGLSVKGILKPEMVASMADNPIIFALANPDPEILPAEVSKVRDDAIMATGRSDFPNQVNNVLGFPFIFRGALDVRATTINEEMKTAATRALAQLAKEEVPLDVLNAYATKDMQFGRNYIIPKPFDVRVLYRVAPAVAQAAMESGVARRPIHDFQKYREQLERQLHPAREVMQQFIGSARRGRTKRIVYPQGEHHTILRARQTITDLKIAHPILLGNKERIQASIKELDLQFEAGSYTIVDPAEDHARLPDYVEQYRKLRERRGSNLEQAQHKMRKSINLAMMMVKMGDADGCVSGIDRIYSETIRPAFEIIGLRKGAHRACGMYMILDKKGQTRFFADATLHTNPTAEELAYIATNTAKMVRSYGVEPRVAMLSFSNFGSAEQPESLKVRKATQIARSLMPDLMIEGEIRVDVAVDPQRFIDDYPFCELKKEANVFIFPDLNAGNISYQLMQYLVGMEAVGPILVGLDKPISAIQRGCDQTTVIHMTAIHAVMAKTFEERGQVIIPPEEIVASE